MTPEDRQILADHQIRIADIRGSLAFEEYNRALTLKQLITKGYSKLELARALNIAPGTLYAWLKK